MNSGYLQTVRGPVSVEKLGLILPHEHLFTDLRGPLVADYAQASPEAVGKVMLPYLKEAHDVGVTALVECSTVGVGRNLEVFQYLAEMIPIHIIAPSGVYREEYIPQDLKDLSTEELAERWIQEIKEGINGTQIRAGFIKISMSDDGPTPLEVRSLKAAAEASMKTGAVIASHTANGTVYRKEIEILLGEGLDPGRFIWVHASLEADGSTHLEAVKLGVFVEFDTIGAPWQPQSEILDQTLGLIEAGYEDKILLSHDAGWYQPGQQDGHPEGGIRGYTALSTEFLPKLEDHGMSDDLIKKLTVSNPIRAFSFE
jgi:phosphotriesterase-related protein